MMINRSYVLPALLALAARNADAFVPVNLAPIGSARVAPRFSMLASEVDIDVSVDYDAAAKLAYSDWCNKYGKESNDAKFATFKANYEALTVANVSAAKKARDNGTERPRDLELNEFGDMTEEEYMKMQSGGSSGGEEAAPRKGALETAMEASVAQSDASNALAEAADALAEEEQKLAEQLGMGSIEELEQALDAMAGIDTDGGEIDTSDVREARVRSAYLDWCKEYGKTADESRFPTFSSNFLAMEEYAQENGREMVLNKYADCTEEEYRQVTNTQSPVEPEPKVEFVVEAEKSVESVEVTAPAPKKEVNEEAPVAKEEVKLEVTKKEEAPVAKKEVKAEVKKEEAPETEVKAAPKPAPKPAPKVEPVMSLEEEAIKLAREQEEKEAAQIAARRLRDEAAAELERMKAKEALENQQQLAANRSAQVPLPLPKVQASNDLFSSFSSILGGSKSTTQSKPIEKIEAPKVVQKIEPPKVAPPKVETKSSPLAFFQPAASPKTVVKKESIEKEKPAPIASLVQPAPEKPKVAPVQPKADVKKVADIEMAPNAMTEALTSFFGSKPSRPAAAKAPVVPPSASLPAPAPTPAAAKTEKPKQAFFSFFGVSPSPAVPAPKDQVAQKVSIASPAPKPAPSPKAVGGLFSFGTAAPKKAAPQPPSIPASKPQEAKGSGTFSLFGGSATEKKIVAETPKPAPVAPKKSSTPALSGFFGGSAPTPAPKAPPVQPSTPDKAPKARGPGTFSLFGGSAPSKPSPPVISTPPKTSTPPKSSIPPKTPVVKKSAPKKFGTAVGVGGLGTFAQKKPSKPQGTQAIGKSGPGTISIAKTSPPPKMAAQKSPTFSLFSSQPPKKASPEPSAPPVAPAKAAQKSPTFSLFGSSPKQQATAAAATKPVKPQVAAKPSGFSVGGAKKPAAVSDVPVISNFKQNADGSITGKVSNSNNFRTGTTITTSPVKKGAKSGEIVTTSSGSKYRLQ